ncbi:PIN domain-containing protein [Rhizobium oryzicola]|uniref:PIN domain-containing protein n=2 Tax=Rhizobium oryzicola TaxID=1232668 RepID=A0ABT8SSM4_9HYPH|nr:PIN domain-containing protein [Rhizobium oryzicola]MDO1581413.1 PIN domain-containing protein [Rhizobium oryzicola]
MLDVNVLVSNLMAYAKGHQDTASQTLVSMVSNQTWGLSDKSQLIISFEMIETLETVLRRLSLPQPKISAYCSSIIDVMRYGPDALDPYLILGGEERLAISDVEDAGVLAVAFGAKVDILVTDNLRDFISKDAEVIDTQIVQTRASGQRTLQAIRYAIADIDMIIAHPFDVLQWMRSGYDFTPAALWTTICKGE